MHTPKQERVSELLNYKEPSIDRRDQIYFDGLMRSCVWMFGFYLWSYKVQTIQFNVGIYTIWCTKKGDRTVNLLFHFLYSVSTLRFSACLSSLGMGFCVKKSARAVGKQANVWLDHPCGVCCIIVVRISLHQLLDSVSEPMMYRNTSFSMW